MMNLSKWLIAVGVVLAACGLVLGLASKLPGFDRLGRLPGDLYVERKGFSLYFPWVTCLLLSALFSLVLYLFRGGRN